MHNITEDERHLKAGQIAQLREAPFDNSRLATEGDRGRREKRCALGRRNPISERRSEFGKKRSDERRLNAQTVSCETRRVVVLRDADRAAERYRRRITFKTDA